MDFTLSEQQKNLVASFRAFGDTYFSRASIRQYQRDQGLPDNVTKAFVDLYYANDELDPARSAGGSLLAQTLVNEEITRSAGAMLPFSNDILNLKIMEEFATSGQFQRVHDEYRATGRLAFAIAVSEPNAGSDTLSMTTSVTKSKGKLVLNGAKCFVANGEYAPNIMVAALDKTRGGSDRPELSFWLLPRTLEGIEAYPVAKIGQMMQPFSDVVFHDVEIDESYRLKDTKRNGFAQLFHTLEIGRVLVCASSLGLAQAAMEDAVAHAKQRQAFGAPIASFQQIETMLVDMEVKIATMRHMVYAAACDFDDDAPDKRLTVALMKRYVPATATEVASDALQILGGRGYTEDERVSWIWKDCRGNQIAEGTDQIMVRIAAPKVLDRY